MKKIFFTLVSIILILPLYKANAFNRGTNLSSKKVASHLGKSSVNLKNNRTVIKRYALTELTKNIEYDFGKTTIRESYLDKLDQLAKTLIDNKSALALRGYADSIGTFKGNWVISDKRATAVKNYLVKKGVDGNKIITTPFGSTKPIASNKTKEGRQKNRRVEFKIDDISK